ncbi:DUF6402 family protein [Cognaticolwellia aestuarii]|uniref:DUF6402 family protein n=1 Tax=Cognaticolwellia aestuarii TaxID=329993 RepID=UPI000985D9C7|nr:DUF6402 family protein [Cognaticolwellia aestuarii]
MIRIFLLSFLYILITGCSKNEDIQSSIQDETLIEEGVTTEINEEQYLNGRFIDSLVDGLSYKTESYEGVTIDGTFKYQQGETITFNVAGLDIGTVHGSSLITPLDFDNPLNLGRILQTLDDDANTDNGIYINEAIQNSQQLTGEGSVYIEALDENQSEILDLTGLTSAGTRSLVSKNDAQEHLYRNIAYAKIAQYVTNDAPYEASTQLNHGYNQPYSSELRSLFPALPYMNAGIDIIIPTSTDILSLSDGVVTRVKQSIGAIFIKPNHQNGTLVYMHLSEIHVQKGDTVTQGTIIGKSGSTGTNSEYLHLEWIKDSTYLENDPEPDSPKEISVYNQGIEYDTSDVTYDLKNFSNPLSEGEAANLVGTWVLSVNNIPDTWNGSIYEVLRVNGNNSNFSTTLSIESDCGKLTATSQADVSLEIENQELKVTFEEPLEESYVSCDDDGSWVRSVSYPENTFLHYKISKSISSELTLIDTGCSFTLYNGNEPTCVVENQSFYKESSNSTKNISVEEIPILMELKGWSYASMLLSHWFDGEGKNIISPLSNITDISTETSEYINELEEIATNKSFLTNGIKQNLIKELGRITNEDNLSILKHGGSFDFISSELEIAGDSYQSYRWELDNLHFVSEHKIEPSVHPLTEEVAALNRYAVRILLKGHVEVNTNSTEIKVNEAGIYVKDSFDMIGKQHLGCWSHESPYVKTTSFLSPLSFECIGNSDFRKYKLENNLNDAGDYLIYTDPMEKKITISESFSVE